MNLIQKVFGFFLFFIPFFVIAATPVPVVAPSSNINMFINSSGSAIPTASYTTGTHAIFGSVQLLKSGSPGYSTGTTTVQQRLQANLFMSSKTLDSVSFASVNHQRLSENGITPGQCVAFTKAMTGAPGTTGTWRAGNAMTTLFPSGLTVQGLENTILSPGTMIAHFGGKTYYNQNTTNPHVAIVLSVSATGNVVNGFNVVDQNSITSATINGTNTTVATASGGGTILKHFLPWSSTSSDSRLSAKNYRVVTQCPTGQTCP